MVEVIFEAFSTIVVPWLWPFSPAVVVISTPCCRRSCIMVVMSASRGTLCRVSGRSLSIDATINGRAAFLAPEMRISPFNWRPPLMRILSMVASAQIFGRVTPRWP